MKTIQMTAAVFLVCVFLLSIGTNAKAADRFDARDYLPEGELFCLPSLTVEWSGEELLLRDTLRNEAEVETALDSRGRLRFTASFESDEDAFYARGTIDISAAGQPFIEIDIWHADGSSEALWAAQIEIGNPSYLLVKGCDCKDRLTFGCTNNDCNDGAKCLQPPSNGDYVCRWAATVIVNLSREDADN